MGDGLMGEEHRSAAVPAPGSAPGPNPFLAHRRHLDIYHRTLAAGLADADYQALVVEADRRVAAVDGTGFVTTPLVQLRPGPGQQGAGGWPDRPVLAKVETANVGGSHKARHLFGLLLALLIDERTGGPGHSGDGDAELAIASCGNAAIGAAVVAAAAERDLRVFVPFDADPVVLERLVTLGAGIEICPRVPGESGDPCVAGLDRAVAAGAKPFTVQGPRCPDVIDGARTIGLELADQLDRDGWEPSDIYIQIGGGALATAVMDGLRRARPGRTPLRLHPVQAAVAHPYVATWRTLAPLVLADAGVADPGDDRLRAEALARALGPAELADALVRHAGRVVPWPGTPRSVASGILDDVAYDWVTVLTHQVTSGGWPVLVEEVTFVRAAALAGDLIAPAPAPDATGAAGLAGLLSDHPGPVERGDAPAVVLLTGVDRSPNWGTVAGLDALRR